MKRKKKSTKQTQKCERVLKKCNKHQKQAQSAFFGIFLSSVGQHQSHTKKQHLRQAAKTGQHIIFLQTLPTDKGKENRV